MKYYFQIVLFCLLCCPYGTFAQVTYEGVISTKNGIQLFQDAYNENAYYYLPKAPRLVKNEDSTFQVGLIKHLDTHQKLSGAYFSAVLEYRLDPGEVKELEKELKSINNKAFIKGQLPLFTFKEDARYGNTSFKLISSTFSAKNELLNEVLTSGQAPLQSGAKAAIMMELSQQGASLLEQSLLQNTSDLNVLMTAYYPALSPSFLAKISAPTQKINQVFQRNFQQKVLAPSEVQELMQSQEINQMLNIEIFDENNHVQKTARTMEIIQLFTEQLIPQFFEPVIGSCADKASGVACLQLKNKPKLKSENIQIVLQSNSIVKVPLIMAANISGFVKSEADRANYVKTIQHNKDFIGRLREVVVKVDEHYLEAFDNCLKGVAVKIKTSTSARPVELSFNWSEIRNGQYKKQLQLRFQNPDDTLYYQTGWQFGQKDTTIIMPWVASSNPFITLVPPLDKQVVDLYYNGDNKNGVRKIIVEFSGRVGQGTTDKIINKIDFDNPADFQAKSLVIFTDKASAIRYQSRWYFNDKEAFKQKSMLLKTDNLISLKLEEE